MLQNDAAVSAEQRASVLERDALLLSFVVGAIPSEIRRMERKLDECESSVTRLREQIGAVCEDDAVADVLGAYYHLNKQTRECSKLLSSLSSEIGARLNEQVRMIETAADDKTQRFPQTMERPRLAIDTKTTTTTRKLN